MATYRKLPSGKWQARVSRDGKETSIGTFRTKKEAEIAANKIEERIYYGQALNDRNMLFEDVANEWLFEYKRKELKDSTFRQHEVILRLHLLPHFGSKKIMKIRRADVKKWIDKFEEYSQGARMKYLSLLKGIFHYAVHDLEILEKNPCDRLKIPNAGVEDRKKKVKYYSLAELDQLMDYMSQYKHQRFQEYQLYYTLMYLLSRSGLRISEALALRWSDLDGSKLTVDRQTSRDNNNRLVLTSLKNTASYRTISIDDSALRVLRKFKLKQNELVLSRKGFYSNPDGIIFHNYLGNYLTPSTVRDTIKEYCKMAGVGYKGTHGFRHTHAVLLLEAGSSLKFVSDRLGHETIKTTADTYLSITEKIEEDELKKFASYTARAGSRN